MDKFKMVLENFKTPKRDYRAETTAVFLESPELISELVTLTFDFDNKNSNKAGLILEYICTHHGIDYILPYLDGFTTNISKVHLVSVTRACAKICEHLAIAYTNKKENNTKDFLTQQHISLLIETGFDWLISEQKVAVKAYTMQTLFLFGKNTDWVLPELEHIIRTKVIHQSKGCEARGRKILALIQKQN